MFFMNLFFPYQLAMYLIFVDWEKVAGWLNRPPENLYETQLHAVGRGQAQRAPAGQHDTRVKV
jgi:hypothetical protein